MRITLGDIGEQAVQRSLLCIHARCNLEVLLRRSLDIEREATVGKGAVIEVCRVARDRRRLPGGHIHAGGNIGNTGVEPVAGIQVKIAQEDLSVTGFIQHCHFNRV